MATAESPSRVLSCNLFICTASTSGPRSACVGPRDQATKPRRGDCCHCPGRLLRCGTEPPAAQGGPSQARAHLGGDFLWSYRDSEEEWWLWEGREVQGNRTHAVRGETVMKSYRKWHFLPGAHGSVKHLLGCFIRSHVCFCKTFLLTSLHSSPH